jgi:hypothetical protein
VAEGTPKEFSLRWRIPGPLPAVLKRLCDNLHVTEYGVPAMLLEVSETVVYPHHGALGITEVTTRTMRSEEKGSTLLDEVVAS